VAGETVETQKVGQIESERERERERKSWEEGGGQLMAC